MERQDLLNAYKLLRDHCESKEDCENCEVMRECTVNLDKIPEHWNVGDKKEVSP